MEIKLLNRQTVKIFLKKKQDESNDETNKKISNDLQ